MATAKQSLKAFETSIRRAQTILGVDVDGDFGPKSKAAEKRLRALVKLDPGATWLPAPSEAGKWHEGEASSFADPADIVAFKRCKATGKTDLQCFAVGDNGIGQFGANTAQEHTPMCALHKDDMIAEFGSVLSAAHKKVEVESNGRKVVCAVEDRMSARSRVDLNPAACKALGLRPPVKVKARWRKV